MDSKEKKEEFGNYLKGYFKLLLAIEILVFIVCNIFKDYIIEYNISTLYSIYFTLFAGVPITGLLYNIYYYVLNIEFKMFNINRKIYKSLELENIEYYREILNLSPFIVARLAGGVKRHDLYSAALLYYINKDYLEIIKNNKIKKTKKSTKDLLPHEVYFIKYYDELIDYNNQNNNYSFNKDFQSIFLQYVDDDMQILDLRRSKRKKSIIPAFFIYILSSILCCSFISYLPNNAETIGSSLSIGLLMCSVLLTVIILILTGNKEHLTAKGIDEYTKVIKLKKFLDEFGNFDDKKIDDINLWNDYIVYAIIFDIKGNLDRESFELYKVVLNNIEEEKYDVYDLRIVKIVISIILILTIIIAYLGVTNAR